MIKSTTIETWQTNPADVGPLYPYAGTEILLCALCVTFFVGFIVWKFKTENQTYKQQSQASGKSAVDEIPSSIVEQKKQP